MCALICFLLMSANVLQVIGQTNDPSTQATPLSKRAIKYKKKIEKIGRFGDLTIVVKNGNELYGSVDSIGGESMFINEIDKNQKLEVRYEEIKNVWKNYGTSRARNGKRIRPRKHLMGLAIATAAIAIPVVLVLTQLKE